MEHWISTCNQPDCENVNVMDEDEVQYNVAQNYSNTKYSLQKNSKGKSGNIKMDSPEPWLSDRAVSCVLEFSF